ncbi:MAG: ABC transporter substrate-binding protein [Clostridia bacterium]|nr:ABC transporter substrate-binding protein [Clostridia bacterium]
MKAYFKAAACMLVLILFVSGLSGCTTYENFVKTFSTEKEPEDVVRIGVFEPLSGEDSEFGKLEKQGIELAHELYPKALNKQVELVYADNKSDIYTAESVIMDLISKRPAVVLGSYGSVYSLVAAQHLEEAQIPAIAITNTNPLVTANNPFYFRVCLVESFQGVALAKYAVQELGCSSAAIMKPLNDDTATAVSQIFSDKMVQLTENPNAVQLTVEYEKDAKDLREQLQQLKDSGAKVVFLPVDADEAADIVKQAYKLKLDTIFLGTQEWETDEFIKDVGPAASNIAFSTYFDSKSAITEMTDTFLRAYKQKYGEDAVPDSAVALGFDAYMIAVDSLNRIGTALDGDLMRRSILIEREFNGASGIISFDGKGDPIKSVVIKAIINGEYKSVYTMVPVFEPVEL